MKNAITYFEPVHSSTQSAFDAERYRQSVELYDNKQYTEALHTFLDSLNPKFRETYGNAEGTEFHIPHGSIVVDILLADDRLRFHADFMELPAKGSVAMLRQVAGLNTNQLLLPTFLLEGNKLTLDYTCPIQRSHPAKLYGVLRDICYIGDQYDDEFSAKFGATRLYTPNVRPYSTEEIDRTTFHVQCGSCEELIAEEEEFCPSCGEKLPEGAFAEYSLSPIAQFCEEAIAAMGINPVLARGGADAWRFHRGSSEIRMFVYDNDYLFMSSPIVLLPKKEVEPVLRFMLGKDFLPYKLGIEGKQVYLNYRIHLSDITEESAASIQSDICRFSEKADELDNYMVETFGCEFSEYSKTDAEEA